MALKLSAVFIIIISNKQRGFLHAKSTITNFLVHFIDIYHQFVVVSKSMQCKLL